MNMQDVRAKARQMGLRTGRMKKADMIHSIQRAEGNQPCYGHSGGSCSQTGCCFMDDCLKIR